MNLLVAIVNPAILLTIILFFLTIGHFFVKDDKNQCLTLLKKIIIGSIFTVTVTALYVTSFKSIFILTIPIILAFKYSSLRQAIPIGFSLPKISLADAVSLILIPIIFITFAQYHLTGFFDSQNHFFIEVDSSFHIFVGQSIFDTGIESPTAPIHNALAQICTSNPAPYHYFDLYLVGLLQNAIPNLSGIAIYNYIITPFFIFLAFLSILAIINEYRNLKLADYIVALLLLFLIGFVAFDFIGIGNIQYASQTLWGRCRSSLSFILFTFLIIYYKRDDFNNFYFSIALAPILNHYYSFFALVTIACIIAVQIAFKKSIPKKQRQPIAIAVASVIAVWLFYALWPKTVTASIIPYEVFSLPYIAKSLKLLMANVAVKTFYFIPAYLLALLFIWQYRGDYKNKVMEHLTFLVLLIVASLLLQSFGHLYFESFQFETYTFLPALTLIIAIILGNNKYRSHTTLFFSYTLIGILLLPGIVYHINDNKNSGVSYDKINALEKIEIPPVIGYISKDLSASYNPFFIHNASIIRSINNKTWAYGLNIKTGHTQKELKDKNENSYFSKYLKENKKEIDNYNFEDQLLFLNSRNIGYCLVETASPIDHQLTQWSDSIWPISQGLVLLKLKVN